MAIALASAVLIACGKDSTPTEPAPTGRTYFHAYCHPYTNAHGNADSDAYCHPHANVHRNADTNAYTHTHASPHGNGPNGPHVQNGR